MSKVWCHSLPSVEEDASGCWYGPPPRSRFWPEIRRHRQDHEITFKDAEGKDDDQDGKIENN